MTSPQYPDNEVHSCSHYCERPACVKAQRDRLRDQFVVSEKQPLNEKAIRKDERSRRAAEIYAAAGDREAECYSATDAADLLSGAK